MNSSEYEENLSLFVVEMDSIGALFAVEATAAERRKVENLERYSLFIRMPEGIKKVRRVFLEFDDDFNKFLEACSNGEENQD